MHKEWKVNKKFTKNRKSKLQMRDKNKCWTVTHEYKPNIYWETADSWVTETKCHTECKMVPSAYNNLQHANNCLYQSSTC